MINKKYQHFYFMKINMPETKKIFPLCNAIIFLKIFCVLFLHKNIFHNFILQIFILNLFFLSSTTIHG